MRELDNELGSLAIACRDSSLLAGLADANPITGLPTTYSSNFSVTPMEFMNYGATQSDAGVLPSQGGAAWGQLKPFSMFPDTAFVNAPAPAKPAAGAGASGASIFSSSFDALVKGLTPIAQAELAISQQKTLAQQNAAAEKQAAALRAMQPQPRPVQSSIPWTWIAGGVGILVVLGIVMRRR